MFVIMTVDTEIFPVAAIFRVIVVIAVPVMHRQQVQVFPLKFTAALGTDPAVQLERLFPITGVGRLVI